MPDGSFEIQFQAVTHRFLAAAEQYPPRIRAAHSVAGVFLVGLLDYLTGPDFSFSIFYLLPILYASWLNGSRTGLVVSLLSAAAWLIADIVASNGVHEDPVAYWNALVRLGFFLIVNYSVGALHVSLEQERLLARSDRLTGLANARLFYEVAGREVERSRRFKHALALVYIDVDNFKAVNDEFGHSAGDRLLAEMGEMIARNTRKIDLAARLGGDEFGILMIEAGADETRRAPERLQKDLSELARKHDWPITFSIGIAAYEIAPPTVDELVRAADQLMYRGKKAGKNRIVLENFPAPAGTENMKAGAEQ